MTTVSQAPEIRPAARKKKRKQKKQMPLVLQGPVYAAVRTAIGAMLTGDPEKNIRSARAMGRTFAGASFNRKRRERAEQNLEIAFPEWDLARRQEYAVHAYEHLFMLAVETIYAARILNPDGWSDHIQLGDMREALRDLMTDQPALMVTGHSGNWELVGYALAQLGFPMHALYRPLDLKPMDNWLRSTRQRQGLLLVDKFGAARTLPRLMDNGARLGFVADQNAGDRGLFVPFFGRLASSYKTIGLLALRHNAPILCGQARRLVAGRDTIDTGSCGFVHWNGEPFRYRIDVYDVIRPEEWADQPDRLFYITARYRRALEAMVRKAPEQYLWMHRYWKSRPKHELAGKPVPEATLDKIRALPWTTEADIDRVREWGERDAAGHRG